MKKKKENTLANSRAAFNIAKQSPPNNVETTNSIRMFWGHVFVALELVMALTSCSGDAAKTTCDSYRHFTALKNYQLYSWSSEMANPLCDSASVGKMSFISSMAECEAAAKQLNEGYVKDPFRHHWREHTTGFMAIGNTVPENDGLDQSSNRPKGCYVNDGKLYFNAKMSNTGSCDSRWFSHDRWLSQCLCAVQPRWGLKGYDLSNVVETSLRADDGSFDVTGIECAAGYDGVPRATACSADGEAYAASGCVKIKNCTRGSNILGCYSSSSNHRSCDVGYNYSDAVEFLLTDALHNFSVTGLQCPSKYVGTPVATVCADDGEPYSVSGCKKKSCKSRLSGEWTYKQNKEHEVPGYYDGTTTMVHSPCHAYIETKEECEWAASQLNLGYGFAENGTNLRPCDNCAMEAGGIGCFTTDQGLFYSSPHGHNERWDGWREYTRSQICLVPPTPRAVVSPPDGYMLTSLAEENLQMDQFDVSSFGKRTGTISIN